MKIFKKIEQSLKGIFTIAKIRIGFIHSKFPKDKILALAFSVKSSEEMKRRLGPKEVEFTTVQTIHSYALKILIQNKHLLDYQNFKVISQRETNKIVRDIMKKDPKDQVDPLELKRVIQFISKKKAL